MNKLILFIKKHWFTIAVVTLFLAITTIVAVTGNHAGLEIATIYLVAILIVTFVVFADFAYSRFNLPPFWHWKTYRQSK